TWALEKNSCRRLSVVVWTGFGGGFGVWRGQRRRNHNHHAALRYRHPALHVYVGKYLFPWRGGYLRVKQYVQFNRFLFEEESGCEFSAGAGFFRSAERTDCARRPGIEHVAGNGVSRHRNRNWPQTQRHRADLRRQSGFYGTRPAFFRWRYGFQFQL